MVHRFAKFEIDAATREVRAGRRVLTLQPRVFDLLLYLAKHRDRVVPKDELLDQVWPGVLVTDASLQRAISLARTAFSEIGAAGAIRTRARQGYRLCDEADSAQPEIDASSVAAKTAHAAYARGDWAGAVAAFHEVDQVDGLSADDLQRWAHAAQCAGRPEQALGPLERAVAAFTARGDRRSAAWVALLLGQLRCEWREMVLAKGWHHRAARLLSHEPDCREKGYLDLLAARLALLGNDLETARITGERARAAGEKFDDADLEGLGLVLAGEAHLYLGNIREGLAAIDEAGTSVVASGLSAWAGGQVYCGVIYSCLTRADWQRAGQWTDQFTRWSEDRGAAGYPGICRMHRAEVLTVRGDLPQAEREIRATITMLARQAPWAEGEAWITLGDIMLAKGEPSPARAAYLRATKLGWECSFGLALVHFAEGDAAAAAKLLGRAIADNYWSGRSKRGQALAHLAIVTAHAGRLDEARRALATLEREPELTSTPALQALLARAKGEVAAAEGSRGDAIAWLRKSLRGWQAMAASLTAARVRCRLADLLEDDGDKDIAAQERAAALAAFKQAGATGLLERGATALRGRLAGRKCRSQKKSSSRR